MLPPPGGGDGGSNKQFKEIVMVLCTIMAGVYHQLHDNHSYFKPHDLSGKSCKVCTMH